LHLTHSYTYSPPLYLRWHKEPRMPSGINQSLQINLLKQSVNTDAQWPSEQKFITGSRCKNSVGSGVVLTRIWSGQRISAINICESLERKIEKQDSRWQGLTGPCFWCMPKGGSLVMQDQVMWQDRWCPLKTRSDCLEIIPLSQCGVALTKHHCTQWWSIWKCCAAGTMVLKFKKPSGVFGVRYTDILLVAQNIFCNWRRVEFNKAQKQLTSLHETKDLNEHAVICKITGEWEKLTLQPRDLIQIHQNHL